jgi:GNAT superfamily N-acetyltransferase
VSRTVSSRPVETSDDVLLRSVFEKVRAAEFSGLPLNPQQKALFLDQQYALQRHFYAENFPDATHDILLLDGQPAGRLYLDRAEDRFAIIDLALLPEYWSAQLLRELLDVILNEARERGCCVDASIEQMSPELAIYEELGFRRVGEEFVNFRLEWSAQFDASDS